MSVRLGMFKLIKVLVVSVTLTLGWVSAVLSDYLVFYGFSGTVENHENPSAVAVKYKYDGQTPLKEALVKFFDGPTDTETEATGALRVFDCASNALENGSTFDCGSNDVFKSVGIKDGLAHIELTGVPSAPASALWSAFDIPLKMTVTQFSDVIDYKLYVESNEVTGLEWGLGCEKLCFRIPKNEKELKKMLEDQF